MNGRKARQVRQAAARHVARAIQSAPRVDPDKVEALRRKLEAAGKDAVKHPGRYKAFHVRKAG